MKTLKIRLKDGDAVKEFVLETSKFPETVDVSAEVERRTVDGKSIMGIFSLNLNVPLLVDINVDDQEREKAIEESLSKFLV